MKLGHIWRSVVLPIFLSLATGTTLASRVFRNDDLNDNYNGRHLLSASEDKGEQKKGIPYDRTAYGNETVNFHNFTYIHQPEPCSPEHSIVVTVHSAVQNRAKRNVMRSTWANPAIFRHVLPDGFNSKLIFVLGHPPNGPQQLLVNYESEAFRDILQVNYTDHYRNNTYKALYNMRWIASESGCPKVRLVIKTDDDIMFNLRYFEGFWRNFTKLLAPIPIQFDSFILAGNMDGHNWPGRDPHEKWYISFKEYKFSTFPPWVQGMAYFLTPSLARRIYELSFSTPYLFTDDVYISLVADRVENVTSKDIRRFYSSAYNSHQQNGEVWTKTNRVFFHAIAASKMYELWLTYCHCADCSWRSDFVKYLILLCDGENVSHNYPS
ncbi:beta-1,3-galactosyltransferase 5-like [Watersipora subatra]|uniref:beta-1,3-galactosyltransferase 5-like n=1 Tax=Watersipora subatra TaxID=2589382 RepID=UPI00355BABFA